MSAFRGKHGPLLIAEIGGNHEGNYDYACDLVDLAISADVDMIKFQLYRGSSLVSPVEDPGRFEHFKRFELTQDQHLNLVKKIHDAGILYTASVWDLEMMSWIDPHIPIYKIGSGDMTAYPVLREIARTEKPIIVSTGLSTEEEVLDAVAFLQKENPVYRDATMLALLQCTSMYPIQNGDANLSVMARLKALTGLTVGYSDHTIGVDALKYAVAMGAEILEFHFTDNPHDRSFRDHQVSLTAEGVSELISEIGKIECLRGNEIKKPLPIELDNDHIRTFRRAVYLNKDLPAGSVVAGEDLVCLRPNHGIDARDADSLIGKKCVRELKAFRRLSTEDFK